ncbi:MAG: TPM domain-containing protein [Christensenellales bacterium]
MKKILSIFFAVIVLLVFSATAGASVNVPDMTEVFYAADYAGVLSDDTIDYIAKKGYDLAVQTGAELVVLTVDFMDGFNSEEYANAVFNEWKLGDPQKNNGVLILLAVGEGKFWAVQGSGLESSLSSGALDSILAANMEEDFDAGRYDAAVRNTYDAIYSSLERIYGTVQSSDNSYQIIDEGYYATSESPRVSVMAIFILIVAVIIISNVVRAITRPLGMFRPRGYYGGWFGPSHYHHHHRSHRPPRSGSFGGGGRVSGGGSRGGSFGGGGRSGGGRVGGGGGSRGGGAGRR